MASRTRDLLLGPVHVERSRILVLAGVRAGIVATVILVFLNLAGQQEHSLAATVGAVFVAVADAGEQVGRRWRTMLWATLWLMAGTAFGGVAGDYVLPGLIAVCVIALVAGAAGVLGARAAVIGLLALVVYIVFAGAPESEASVVENVLVIGLGGLVMTAVTVGPHLVRAEEWRVALEPVAPLRDRVRGKLNLQNDFVRHGIRLAIVITVATAISDALDWPHDYWLPMSVAWMSRPDQNGTATRIVARITGTVVGVGVVALLVDILEVDDLVMGIAAGVAAGVAVAFIWANYAVAVVGITVLVVGLFSFDGDPVLETMGLRIGLTVAAAALAFAGFLVWPPARRTAAIPGATSASAESNA